jgi:hypothetical protein
MHFEATLTSNDSTSCLCIVAYKKTEEANFPWAHELHCGRSLLGQTYGAPSTSNSFFEDIHDAENDDWFLERHDPIHLVPNG